MAADRYAVASGAPLTQAIVSVYEARRAERSVWDRMSEGLVGSHYSWPERLRRLEG